MTRYSAITSTLALLVSLTLGGAYAADELGKNSVGARELEKNAVRSQEVASNAVGSKEVDLPRPETIAAGGAPSLPQHGSTDPQKLLGQPYVKQDAATVLRVDWSGAVVSNGVPCVFEVRLDGQPSQSQPLYLDAQSKLSVATSVVFPGVPAGPHEVQVWARSTATVGGSFSGACSLGIPDVGIGQSLVVEEVPV